MRWKNNMKVRVVKGWEAKVAMIASKRRAGGCSCLDERNKHTATPTK
jgi:hypothetical protein